MLLVTLRLSPHSAGQATPTTAGLYLTSLNPSVSIPKLGLGNEFFKIFLIYTY